MGAPPNTAPEMTQQTVNTTPCSVDQPAVTTHSYRPLDRPVNAPARVTVSRFHLRYAKTAKPISAPSPGHADQQCVRHAEWIAQQRFDDRGDGFAEEGRAGLADDDGHERAGEQPHEMEESAQSRGEAVEQGRSGQRR